jgi:hypothetical protein
MPRYSLEWFYVLFVGLLSVGTTEARSQKPKIAVFSGPTATIQNSQALVTSNRAREKYGLSLLSHPDGSALRFDALRPQRLAAPVTVYIRAFSAHPLEQDISELYAPHGVFHSTPTHHASSRRSTDWAWVATDKTTF